MIVLGIDPGVTGAIAAVGRDHVQIEDLPTMPTGSAGMLKRKLDAGALVRQLRALVPADVAALVVMEDLHTFPGRVNSPQSQGSLMRTVGVIEGVIAALRLGVHMVQPQAWKAFYGIGSLKASSIEKAQRLYPEAPIRLAKHHNRAEALLLAHYGLRRLT
jgi:hypothetical protein